MRMGYQSESALFSNFYSTNPPSLLAFLKSRVTWYAAVTIVLIPLSFSDAAHEYDSFLLPQFGDDEYCARNSQCYGAMGHQLLEELQLKERCACDSEFFLEDEDEDDYGEDNEGVVNYMDEGGLWEEDDGPSPEPCYPILTHKDHFITGVEEGDNANALTMLQAAMEGEGMGDTSSISKEQSETVVMASPADGNALLNVAGQSMPTMPWEQAWGPLAGQLRVKRSTVGWRSGRLWNLYQDRGKYVIPYKYGTPYIPEHVQTISSAMADIEKHSCIKFVEVRDEQVLRQQYVKGYVIILDEPKGGCHSVIGRKRSNMVSLVKLQVELPNDKTCIRKHVVLHELLHLLGLYHEHQRHGRHLWMDIDTANVLQGREDNFKVIYSKSYGLPFDPNSIMLYKANTFAVDRSKPVIQLKYPYQQCQEVLGKATQASEIDWLKVNLLYHCPKAKAMLRRFKHRRQYWERAALLRGQMSQPFYQQQNPVYAGILGAQMAAYRSQNRGAASGNFQSQSSTSYASSISSSLPSNFSVGGGSRTANTQIGFSRMMAGGSATMRRGKKRKHQPRVKVKLGLRVNHEPRGRWKTSSKRAGKKGRGGRARGSILGG